jgi:transcriptional regulator of acetoin/glycerol metabolism
MLPQTSTRMPTTSPARLGTIAHARRMMLCEHAPTSEGLLTPWIERSWKRCLAMGRDPAQSVGFDPLSLAQARRARDANRVLTDAARPVLQALGRALVQTRYFAILTNAQGVVVDVNGPIDRSDRRADLITRIGVDLSEPCVGTTAIGAALTELQPVWLHRGEHFFNDTSDYSCAGAPLFGPGGECVGMLDLTGVDAPERPELKHLVMQSARSIENILALQAGHALLLRLNWPGYRLGEDGDGLVGLDADGFVTTSNSAARLMLPMLCSVPAIRGQRAHGSELFALSMDQLFDAAHGPHGAIDLPLWSGLCLQACVARAGNPAPASAAWRAQSDVAGAPAGHPPRLKDIEQSFIQRAVEEARGNVAQAALQLGVSRATVYRKLGLIKRG